MRTFLAAFSGISRQNFIREKEVIHAIEQRDSGRDPDERDFGRMTMPAREVEALSECVSEFSEAMRKKLWKKLRDGYGGWNDDSDPSVVMTLQEKLESHVRKYFSRSRAPVLIRRSLLTSRIWP